MKMKVPFTNKVITIESTTEKSFDFSFANVGYAAGERMDNVVKKAMPIAKKMGGAVSKALSYGANKMRTVADKVSPAAS